jgi:hypothetical protein
MGDCLLLELSGQPPVSCYVPAGAAGAAFTSAYAQGHNNDGALGSLSHLPPGAQQLVMSTA